MKIFSVAAIPEFHFLQYIFFFRFEFILSLTQKHLYKNLAPDENKPKEDSVFIFHALRNDSVRAQKILESWIDQAEILYSLPLLLFIWLLWDLKDGV